MIYDLFLFVILSIAKDLDGIHFYVIGILSPYGRLDDKMVEEWMKRKIKNSVRFRVFRVFRGEGNSFFARFFFNNLEKLYNFWP